MTTAGTGASPYFAHLVNEMPAGLILNLGSGATGAIAGVLAKDVLEHVEEHVEDPIWVLTELRRASRDDGRLLVVVPRAIPRAVWDDPTHVRGFTARALQSAFGLSGWKASSPIRRLGGFPGAGRVGLGRRLDALMRIPGLGHWFGRNWIARALPEPSDHTP